MPNPDERSLDETTPAADGHAGHEHGDSPFGNPNGNRPLPKVKQLSLDEVLTSAKRHRTVAHICMRADLQVEYENLVVELAGMLDGQGRVMRSSDESLDEAGVAAVAQEKADRIDQVRREMNEAMRSVEFEGMPEDQWRPWYNQHFPHRAVQVAKSKGEEADITDFNNLLIAEVAASPTLTVDDVIRLRSVLTAPQMAELANKAWIACTTGGVDIPKSPAFLRNLQLQ